MILIAGVGYSHLTDLSFGPHLIESLQRREWPEDVVLEDLSYGPIAVLQWFQERRERFDHAIFVGAMQRENGIPGELRTYRWDAGSWTEQDVQERVAEAVTGIVSLENLLMILDYFGELPDQPVVIEFEPIVVEWGLDLSPAGRERLQEVGEVIAREVLHVHVPGA